MVYNIIIGICFAILTVEVLYLVISWALKDRAGRIAFLRSYKNGKCIIIYFSALPLFFIGYLYSGVDFFEAVFGTLNEVFNLIVLKYSTVGYQALFDASQFYRITVYYCYALVGFNALLFVFSLTCQRIWQFVESVKGRLTKRNRLVIFGYSEENVWVYKSAKDYSALIAADISKEDGNLLYSQKINYRSVSSFRPIVNDIFKAVSSGKDYTALINTGDDEKNLEICHLFIERIKSTAQIDKDEFFKHIRIYVFGEPTHEAIYSDVMASACGCIHYLNKYLMIAMNFIDRYPLTKFMDERHIDYSTSLVSDEVDINVCMIGFGKVNRQIFLTSVANNQFLTLRDGKLALKQVNYHIFDKTDTYNDKNLNHSYFRMRNEQLEGDYLPLPALPATEKYYKMDINDEAFFLTLKSIVCENEKSVNFMIISYDSDLENLDLAHKLIEQKRTWGKENVTLFVRTRVHRDSLTLNEESGCFLIGDEQKDVFDITEITGDEIFKMAQMRNEVYDLEYRITHEPGFVVDQKAVEANKDAAIKRWYLSRHQWERESSLYCCLSLRSKLNLMGLDYVKSGDVCGLTEDEFMKLYDNCHEIEYYGAKAEDKKIVKYPLDFKPSLRTNLAVLEHYRWNSFMISKGFVPADKHTILCETTVRDGKTVFTNGKNYALRRHGNITTFNGLIEFRRMIANRDSTPEAEADVIKYDYQLLDDAYWLLSGCGYKIVRRQKPIEK